jgi:protocatechuate 3,4-dioxygenase beta subunit
MKIEIMRTLSAIVLSTLLFVSVSAMAESDKVESKNSAETAASASMATVSLEGRIFDEVTGEALAGVAVKLEGTDKVAYTDFDGNYSLGKVVPGAYSISASFISYERVTMQVNANGSANLNLNMKTIE